jgi:hypothetical protein
VSNIDHRLRNSRLIIVYHRPSRLLPVTESVALPPDLRRAS